MKIMYGDFIVTINFGKEYDSGSRLNFWFEDQTYQRVGWVRHPDKDSVITDDKVAPIYRSWSERSFVVGMPHDEEFKDDKTCKAIRKAVDRTLELFCPQPKYYLEALFDKFSTIADYANDEPSWLESDDEDEDE